MTEENTNLTPWQKYKQNLGETRPWDMVNPNVERLSDEKAEERYSICKSCPELFEMTKQCKKCGCFMAIKTKLKDASCPIGKW
jgi:hypothetical protein